MSEHPGLAPAPLPADVGVVAALALEVADLVDALTGVRKYQSTTVPVIEGEHAGKIVAVAVGGPGRKAARAATEVLISGHRPRTIIAAGFAGALDLSLSRNDLILPDEVIDREGGRHRIELPGSLAEKIRHGRGRLLTVDHVVLTASQKAELRAYIKLTWSTWKRRRWRRRVLRNSFGSSRSASSATMRGRTFPERWRRYWQRAEAIAPAQPFALSGGGLRA